MNDIAGPSHAAPEEQKHETRVPLVYLEQSVWSMWADGKYPPDVMDRLFELAVQGRFNMVISKWHIIETVKTHEAVLTPNEVQQKVNQARFMTKFPNLIGLRDTSDLLIQEVARAYAASQTARLAADPAPWVPIGDIDDVFRRMLAVNAGYIPKSRRDPNVESGGRGSMGFWSWLDNQMNYVNQASFKAAQFDREQNKRPKTWVTSVKERLTNDKIVKYLNEAAATLKPRITFVLGLTAFREAVGEYLGYTPDPLSYWRWLWALDFHGSRALNYRFVYASLLTPTGNRRPQANDGTDVEHGFAAPFVDVLVHEGGHAEFARQAAKKAKLDCQIFSGRPKTNDFANVVRVIEGFQGSR